MYIRENDVNSPKKRFKNDVQDSSKIIFNQIYESESVLIVSNLFL